MRNISVYARVSPEDKIRIVRAWQSQGEIVSMTGDGVNDAPALKAADIGCAMGITGTDVAKGAADMTLTDDNFTTIVDAVREGRGIYDNIKKVVGFLLGTNIGEILCVFFAMILWHRTPLLSMQLLLINLATDSLPAIALGMEAVERDVMEHKPRPRSEGLFAKGYGLQIALQGLMFGALTLIALLDRRASGRQRTGRADDGLPRAGAFAGGAGVQHALHPFAVQDRPVHNHKLNWRRWPRSRWCCWCPSCRWYETLLSWSCCPTGLYLWALALILFPIVAMEAAKALDFIKHRH